ncbi:hypothetical protein [Streptomyces azureus]|nr:hypothetical protein [Streptomyces azureus]
MGEPFLLRLKPPFLLDEEAVGVLRVAVVPSSAQERDDQDQREQDQQAEE